MWAIIGECLRTLAGIIRDATGSTRGERLRQYIDGDGLQVEAFPLVIRGHESRIPDLERTRCAYLLPQLGDQPAGQHLAAGEQGEDLNKHVGVAKDGPLFSTICSGFLRDLRIHTVVWAMGTFG